MLRVFLIIMIGIGLSSCGDDMDCEAEFGTPFIAEEGGEYCFPDGSILFISEFNTSYCGCDHQCVWQGETVVVGTWTDSLGKTSALMIHEELKDQNLPWAAIFSISLDEECEPNVIQLNLKIDKPSKQKQCQSSVIVDEEEYKNGPMDFVNIVDAAIDGDCLSITYSASGCSGDKWVVNLYDSEGIAESDPEQRYLRLSMMNPEACLAVFQQEKSFDISDLQIQNGGVLILNLQDYKGSLRYKY